VGNSIEAVTVGIGDAVSDGGGVTVSVIGTLVSISRRAGIVGAADGVADNAGAVQASAIAKRRESRIKERFLSGITSSTINFIQAQKYGNESVELFNITDWNFLNIQKFP